jgi:hypothetical protein
MTTDKPIRMDQPKPGEDPEEIAAIEAMVSQAAQLALELEGGAAYRSSPVAPVIARLRAALRLLENEHITPQGRRILENILDEEERLSFERKPAPDHRPQVGLVDGAYKCTICSGDVRHLKAKSIWIHQ